MTEGSIAMRGHDAFERMASLYEAMRDDGIVKLRLTTVSDAQHGGFTADSSAVSWGSID